MPGAKPAEMIAIITRPLSLHYPSLSYHDLPFFYMTRAHFSKISFYIIPIDIKKNRTPLKDSVHFLSVDSFVDFFCNESAMKSSIFNENFIGIISSSNDSRNENTFNIRFHRLFIKCWTA